ncbi:MAG: tRNA pseudouridine(55) synthase TruB [Kiritimatiellae bacterium]|nr:tRNA pseudouridine(55) synthase TruB [Kiritimatiellia bacterium]
MSRDNPPSARLVYAGGPLRDISPWDGLLLVDKPSGMTSHDVVHRIRRTFKIKKVGHGGTLDPMATGLLLILTGRGTKLSGDCMGSDKIYTGTMTLGITTDSQDADGTPLETRPFESVSREAVEAAMKQLTGDIHQVPPMVSAIKKNGVPLYKLARKGETVEREPRLIHVYRFVIDRFSLPEIDFTVSCTKGTYVRTLAADLGEMVGCGAHLTALRRTASGQFSLEEAKPLNELLELSEVEFQKHILPMPKAKLRLAMPG